LIIPKHLDEEQERQKKFVFNDDKHRLGQFCYTRWKKSHHYVLTTTWKSFVKGKKLKVGDFLCFDRWKYSLSFITVRNMMRRTNMMANQLSVKVKAARNIMSSQSSFQVEAATPMVK